jgi:hypothetical protein
MRLTASLRTSTPCSSKLTPTRKMRRLIWSALAISFVFTHASWATPVTITSLVYVHPTPGVDCEDTVAGEPLATACSPVGVTDTGSLTNPFLNDINTKAIDIGFGSYYTFGNPYAPTDFMTQGDSIEVLIGLSNGTTLSDTILVPDLTVAGTTMFDFASYGITITTTGITTADRMSFGLPPGAFVPDGTPDYTLDLNFAASSPSISAIPEPGSALLLLTALSAAPRALRKRSAWA